MNILSDIFNVIIPIGAAIRNPTPANVILLVFLVAVLGFVGFQLIKFHFYEYKKIKSDLDDGLSLIKDLTSDDITVNYEKINQELSSNSVLGKLWYEYDKTVLKIKNEDEESVYSTVDAGFFFNNSNIIDARMNVQFYNAVPGILTGVGILGTFVGLTIGLSQIDLAADDVQVLKEGIKGLLAGVSTAFATSVWGISFSVIFTFFTKWKLNSLQLQINKFCQTVDSLFVRKTPECLLSEMLTESRDQTQELKAFNSDLAISIAGALDEALANRLSPTLEELLNSMNNFSNSLPEALDQVFVNRLSPTMNGLQESIKELTNVGTAQIAETISSSAGNEITELGKVLDQVQETLKATVISTNGIQEQMSANMNENIRVITETVNNFMDTVVKGQDEVNDKVHSKLESLMAQMEDSLNKQQERIEESTSRSSDKFMQQIETVSQEVTALLSKFGQQTDTSVEMMRSQNEEMSEKFKQVIEDIALHYQEERTNVNELLKHIGIAIQQIDSLLLGAGQTATAFEKAAIPVSESGTQLRNAIIDIKDYQKVFGETVHRSQEQLHRYTEVNENTLESIRTLLSSTQESWQAYENKFGVIRGDLEAIFDELGKGLREYKESTGEGLKNYLNDLDQHEDKIIGLLSGAIEELGGTVTELESTIDKLTNGKTNGKSTN